MNKIYIHTYIHTYVYIEREDASMSIKKWFRVSFIKLVILQQILIYIYIEIWEIRKTITTKTKEKQAYLCFMLVSCLSSSSVYVLIPYKHQYNVYANMCNLLSVVLFFFYYKTFKNILNLICFHMSNNTCTTQNKVMRIMIRWFF